MQRRPLSVALGMALALASAAQAQTTPPSPWRTDYGTFSLDSRLRYENVDDEGFADRAEALTWRNRLGFRSKVHHGFSVYVEAEDVRALVDDYASANFSGNTRAIISDEEGSEWNQAHLSFDSGKGFKATLGRQKIVFDNQRFFGNVGWRQNEQTFDALSLNWTLPNQGVLDLAWLDEAHRIFGNEHPNPALRDWDLNAPLIHYSQAIPTGSLAAYGYFVENEEVVNASASTLGVRYSGKSVDSERNWNPLWTLEYARQNDYADATNRDTQDYRLLEFGFASSSGHTLKAGWEVLGGDGSAAFQTPFATLHAFNGWADRFLVTPSVGLDDRYLAWTGPCFDLTCGAQWHEYESDTNGVDLGRELGFSLAWNFSPGWTAMAKYAGFSDADTLSDVNKLWLSVEYKR